MVKSKTLAIMNPELALEWHPTKNKGLLPSDVSPGSSKKVWWQCPKCGYEWETTVNHRANGRGCPKCSKRRAAEKLTKKNLIAGETDLKTRYPDIASQWDYEKNKDRPEDWSPFSNRKKWWICEKGHSYDMAIVNRTSLGQGCPYCAGRRVLKGFNDLSSLRPEIANEWDYEKNSQAPEEFTVSSNRMVFWKCREGHSYKQAISERTRTDGRATGCPYCANKKVLAGFNDLETIRPDVLINWDYVKNVKSPSEYLPHTDKKVWWTCSLGHSYVMRICDKTKENPYGCPICSGKQLLTGFNDLRTLFPDVAAEWSEENDSKSEDHTAGTHEKAKWKCSRCGYVWTASIKQRTYSHNGCPRCTHYFKTSSPEQALFFYIRKAFPDAINSYTDARLGNREIDIYIPSLKLGIEYDGGFWHESNGKDLKKTRLLKALGIDLIRVRERKAPPLEDGSIQIVTKETSDDLRQLEPAIRDLFSVISMKVGMDVEPDINIERDYQVILASAEGNRFEKSLLASEDIVLMEWNYEKNGDLTPDKFTRKSKKRVWWRCSKCGKEWQQSINTKTKGGLYCETCNKSRANRQRALDAMASGKSIPLTDYPLLVKEWNNDEDINLYTRGSDKKVRWKCSVCGNVFYQAIKNRTLQGQGCPRCADKRKGRKKANK